jgi:hypothetical protein
MADAAYYRAWRAAHPEYRARQNQLRAERRRLHGREDRSREYARRRQRATPPIPPLHDGHDLFDRARQILGPRRTTLVFLHDTLYEDLMSEATLALIEGRDPRDAIRVFRSRERAFGRITCPLFEDAA